MKLRPHLVALVSLLVGGLVAPPPRAAAQLVAAASGSAAITDAVPDVASGTLTVTGSGFGRRPFVTLNLIPLDVEVAIDTRIVARVPLAAMPPGEYLLTISRGPGQGETASIDVPLHGGAPSPSAPAVTVPPQAASDVAATVGDQAITVAEVDRAWQRSDPAGYVALMRQLEANRRRIANQLVAEALLAREAASRGATTDALLKDELPKRTIAMPDAAVTSLYASLGDRTRGASLDQMRPALRAWLAKHTEPELAKMTFVEELMKTTAKAEVVVPALSVAVDIGPADPALGAAGAPITLVAFGDLQSNDYVRLAQEFGRLRDTFGARLRLVYKAVPTFGPASAGIAQAAACAHEQGRFWAYHDAALKPGTLEGERLSTLAREVGVDAGAFERCMRADTSRALPQRATDEASRYGVATSPAFIVNGRLAPDPPPFLPPFEYLKRLVEEELQHQARQAASPR